MSDRNDSDAQRLVNAICPAKAEAQLYSRIIGGGIQYALGCYDPATSDFFSRDIDETGLYRLTDRTELVCEISRRLSRAMREMYSEFSPTPTA